MTLANHKAACRTGKLQRKQKHATYVCYRKELHVLLIGEVEKHPRLYKQHSKDFRDMNATDNAFLVDRKSIEGHKRKVD